MSAASTPAKQLLTAAASAAAELLTLGQAARRCGPGVDLWMVQRVIARGLAPEPAKVGRHRVLSVDDLPALRLGLQLAGYLPADAAPEQGQVGKRG
ncbi:MAG TPA: hypothetical protein VFW33_13740 [Gemmataceae bacterium]|nr:hypothetical protein [Gemmataceae bacterium]